MRYNKHEYILIDNWELVGGGITIIVVMAFTIWLAMQYLIAAVLLPVILAWLTYVLTKSFIIPLEGLMGFHKRSLSALFRAVCDSTLVPLPVQCYPDTKSKSEARERDKGSPETPHQGEPTSDQQ